MANSLVSITILLADNIRGCLQRAGKTEDVAEIRSILTEIEGNVTQLTASAVAQEEAEHD